MNHLHSWFTIFIFLNSYVVVMHTRNICYQIFYCNMKFLKENECGKFKKIPILSNVVFKNILRLRIYLGYRNFETDFLNSVQCAWCSRYRNVKGGNFLRQKMPFLSCLVQFPLQQVHSSSVLHCYLLQMVRRMVVVHSTLIIGK